jgi:hypothetical protein
MDICLEARPNAFEFGTHKLACYLFGTNKENTKAGEDQNVE